MRYEKIILMSLLASLLSACSSIGGFFHDEQPAAEASNTDTDKQQNTPKPTSTVPVSDDVLSDQKTSNPVTAVATTDTNNPAPAIVTTQPLTTQTTTTTTTTSTPVNAPVTAPASVASTITTPVIAANQPPVNSLVALSMHMDYQQAWSQLGSDLPKAGYPIVEQDSNAGIYYILDRVGSGGTITPQTPIYQLHVQKITADKTRVFLYDAQNQPANSALAQRILGSVTTH